MKKKKINKISKKIFEQISENYTIVRKKKTESKEKYYDGAIEPSPMVVEEEYICEYDEEVSTKFKKLFNNIIKYPDNIKISHTSTYINIEVGNIKYIKKAYPSSNGSMMKSSGEEQLSIYIFKDKCFNITQGYSKQTRYTDVNMYNELIDIVKDKVKEINANNFNTIWENISRESGILRDSNLDEILSDVV